MKTPTQILYLEDDANFEEVVKLYLEKEGIESSLHRVDNRADFESSLSQKSYDLILIDRVLKDIDGFEAISIIRKVNLLTPIIVLSGMLDEDLIVKALQLGADDYIVKENITRIGPSAKNALDITSKNRQRQHQAETVLQKNFELEERIYESAKELYSANSYIQAILDELIDGIITIDTKGNIKSINPAVTEIFGYSEQELLGQNVKILMPDPYHSEHDGYIENYVNSGKSKIIGIGRTVEGKRKNGEIFPLDLSVTEIKSHGNHYFTGLVRDISERVAMETELRKSQARFATGQKFANLGTWDWNIQTGELYWSERIGPLFGYPVGELETSYDNFINAVHPDDRQAVIDAINTCVDKGVEYNIEHRCLWPDGTVRWLHEKGDVVRSEDGSPLDMLGVVEDITDRKQTEEALAENASLLKEAQQIGKIGNWSLDISTSDLTWSDEIYRIFGYKPNEFAPSYDRFFSTVHPDDVDKIKQSEKEAFEHNKPHSIDHRIVLPDGEIRWVHEEAHTTYDENNKPVKLSGTVQDITDRKFNEEKLILTNDILHQVASGDDIEDILGNVISGVENLLSDSICSILVLDDNKLYNRVDNRLPEFFNQAIDGLQIGEGAGSCGTAAFRNNRVIVDNIFSHPYWKDFTGLAKKANLAACWSEPIRSLSTKPFGTFAIYYQHPKSPNMAELDIIFTAAQLVSIALLNEQHKNSLQAAKDDAVKANRAKSDFLSQMSHELRTPLNAIIGFSQLLELDDSLNKNQADDVKEIHSAGNLLLDLINEILDLSKVESGNIEIEQQEVDLLPVIDECINLTENLSSKSNITIEKQNNFPSENITINADPKRLKQSILNLLSNAIKYNKENGAVFVSCLEADNDHVQINIADTGAGLSNYNLKKLFTPFNRLHAENSDIEGTGIGLVITKQLVELMGGSINVESEEGVGSTFSLTFELTSNKSTLPGSISDKRKQYMENSKTQDKTIIYIEDNPVNLKFVEKALKRYNNIKLLTAMDPEKGIDLANSSAADLILLDINLPKMNGFEVLKILKENSAVTNTPIIALSASAMTTDIDKGIQAGFDDYLTKPIDLSIFYDMLDKYLK